MFGTPVDEFGDDADLRTVQGLKLIRIFHRIDDAETRDLILHLVEMLAQKHPGARQSE